MKLQFDWSYFDEEFLHEIVYSDATPVEKQLEEDTYIKDFLVSAVSDIAIVPNQDFVMRYRTEIEDCFLKKHPRLIYDVFKLNNSTNYLTELERLINKPLTTGLVTSYLKALSKVGYGEYEDVLSDFIYTYTVDLANSEASEKIKLYDYQEAAYNALNEFFIEKNNNKSFLVMPTGSGKTRTAVAWLLQEMIPKDYQVIWLTHRHLLIDQAAATFAENSPCVSLFSPDKDKLEIACVSGQHQKMSSLATSNDICVLSINSASRGLEHLSHCLKDKVVLVIDEAHHAVADSYKVIIDYVYKLNPDAKLLGLTATPVRILQREERILTNLFGNSVVYSIGLAELITRGILANPKFKRIMTNENFEAELTEREIKHLRKYKELPAAVEKKIAESKKRNSMIVREYLTNRKLYGKTLIFAMSTVQAVTLADDFTKEGIKCAYVCYTNGKELNNSMIRSFHKGEIDVLVNVNILTEGMDIPDIHTVFLTRQTTSEALLLQMVGRGMRGLYAGGTKDLYVIDFYDEWNIFTKWLNPELVMLPPMPEKRRKIQTTQKKSVAMQWNDILAAYRNLQNIPIIPFSYSKMNLPAGWYDLVDNDGEKYTLLVYSGQLNGYEKIRKNVNSLPADEELTIEYLLKHYFGAFVDIKPSPKNLQIFWENVSSGRDVVFHSFAKRDKIDPFAVAKEIRDKQIYPDAYIEDVYKRYGEARSLFGDEDAYYGAVLEAMKLIKNGMQQPKQYVVEEMPIEQVPLVIDEPYDLEELLAEVNAEMLKSSNITVAYISWTERPMKSYFGMYYYTDNSIQINRLLNSSQVKREAVKYVIYHELLHTKYPHHTNEFKAEEHKYPNWASLEHHLDFELFNGFSFSLDN